MPDEPLTPESEPQSEPEPSPEPSNEDPTRPLKLENLLLRAEVDLDSTAGKVFARSLESADPDELKLDDVKAEAAAVGALKVREEPEPEPSGEPTEAERLAEERQVAAGSAEPTLPEGEDPHRAAEKAVEKRMGEGSTRQDAIAAGFGSMVQAAAAGDKRVLVDKP